MEGLFRRSIIFGEFCTATLHGCGKGVPEPGGCLLWGHLPRGQPTRTSPWPFHLDLPERRQNAAVPGKKVPVPTWILVFGGAGIVTGLATCE